MLCKTSNESDLLSAEVIENLVYAKSMLATLKILLLMSQQFSDYKVASSWLDDVKSKGQEILDEYWSLPKNKQTKSNLRQIIIRQTGGCYC